MKQLTKQHTIFPFCIKGVNLESRPGGHKKHKVVTCEDDE